MYTTESSTLGRGAGSREVWVAALRAHGADVPEEIVDVYMKYAPLVGVNHDLAIAQACDECTWFTDYKWIDYRNPAGLGSTSRGAQGIVFPSVAAGITAQLAHLCAYAYTADTCPIEQMGDEMKDVFNDERHALVGHRGDAHLAYLEGKWAIPGDQYADAIARIANEVVGDSAPQPSPDPPPAPQQGGTVSIDDLGIIDIRDRMAKAPGQGAGYKSAKNGVIIHYNGPQTHDPALDRFISDANFHIGPYLHEYTIAYIYGIGDEQDDGSDAPIYLMRDPDDVCWHCGSWPENATYTPIAFTFGEGQSAGPGQLRSVYKLIRALQERDSFGDDAVKGHKEVDSTACPGTLMDDLIYPLRAGTFKPEGGTPVSDYVAFKETGHGVQGAIRAFFDHNGGVAVLGYPISDLTDDPFGGKNPDGTPMKVQFFEGGILEIHPENQHPNDVQRRRLGAQAALAAGLSGPGVQFP